MNDQQNWVRVESMLPVGDDQVAKDARRVLFEQLDTDGDKRISFEELKKGMQKVFDTLEVKNGEPILRRAFDISRNISKKKGEDTIEFVEFSYMLLYIFVMLRLIATFREFDVDKNRVITLDEFKKNFHILEKFLWAFHDPEKTFHDASKGKDEIDIDDFTEWAVRQKIQPQDPSLYK